MTLNNLILEWQEPGIRIVKINRPAALNALNGETLQELKQVLAEEAKNEKTRVLILTGSGEKAFIAGADIVEMNARNHSQAIQFSQLGHEVTKLLELMPKPTIAAVNGFALGGGTEFACACDFIIASDNAVFGQPEVCLGIMVGFGGSIRLAKFVGWPRAKELIYSGRRVKADEAKEIGLANHVVPLSELMNKTLEIAKSISANSMPAVARSKQLLNEFSESVGLNAKLDSEAQSFGSLFGTPDQKEGTGAFVEKRKPKFQGL